MKNILVTGATGFIGHEVANQLVRKGYRPRLMVRRPIRGILLNSLDAELMQGDLSQPESLKRLVAGMDSVIHLGAMATFESYSKVKPSIVDGSIHLMHAAIEEGVENFIYGGSLLVYDNQTRPINQETASRACSGYCQAKLEAESRMEDLAGKGSVNFTSLRLPHVYGAQSLLFHQIRKGKVFFPGTGDNLFAHLHVADAARALITAAETGLKGTYVIADNLSCTWNDFFEITQGFYPRLKVIHIPERLALSVTGALDIILGFSKTPNRFSQDAVKSWNMSLPVVSGTLSDVLNLEPQYPTIAEGIPAVLDGTLCFTWCPSNLDH
ncbi:MAG: NAD(P)-dependent oxidoreductase [Nitrospiraceae bacterium]|nr:MAG: NAD(P)-dependent oxidoreductase [Nitrospiraceae bacterium]